MKKIIIAFLSLAFLFVGQASFAGTNNVTWNTLQEDCNTIAIANKTQGIGFGNGCWVGENVSSNSGDIIRVRVYYHNTGTSIANNTRIKITKSPNGNSSTYYNFSGQIISDAGTFYSTNPSAVHLTTPTNTTLDYVKTYWYPNQTSGGEGTTLLEEQDGSEVLESGLEIGDIAPGGSTQGTVIAEFKVNANTPPPASCVINNFKATPATINQGGSSLLSWSLNSNCVSATINQGIGAVSVPSGTYTVRPTANITYTLTAKNSNGVTTTKIATVKVTTLPPPPPASCVINNFKATPATINQGGSSLLSWSLNSNCVSATINQGIGAVSVPSGTETVHPTTLTTYTLTAKNSNGVTTTKTATVKVTTLPPPPASCVINNFKATPATINQGGSSLLSWSLNSNCVSATINQGIGAVSVPSGTYTVRPTDTITYVLTAVDQGGRSISRSQTVTVNPTVSNCLINDFDANPRIINLGQSSTLVWVTNAGCATTKLYQGTTLLANAGQYGSKVVSPIITTEYTLQAFKSNGALGDTQNITVGITGSILVPTTGNLTAASRSCVIPLGSSTCNIPFTWNTQNPVGTSVVTRDGVNGNYKVGNSGRNVPFTIKYNSSTFRLYNNSIELDKETVTASCASGTSWNGNKCVSTNTPVCTINNFIADPTDINQGESSLLKWNTSNCDIVKLDGVIVSAIGTKLVYPNATKTYTLVAQKTGILPFEVTAQATVYVDEVNPGCFINDFTANPTEINQGESSILKWDTVNCTSVTISDLGYQVPTNGEQVVWPTRTTTYTLRAYGSNLIPQTRSVTVYVDTVIPTVCAINNFTADPVSIGRGDYSTLNWDTSNCNYVTLEGLTVQESGSRTVFPINTKTYRLTASDIYGDNYPLVKEVTVYVDSYNENTCEITNFEADDTSIDDGDETTLRWETNNCERVKISDIGYVNENGREDVSPNEDTTYILTAYDRDGHSISDSVRIYVDEDNNNNDNCSIDSFTADDNYIDQGDEVTLKWRTSDCDDVSISNIGDVDEDGTEDVYPYRTTTYILRARGDDSESRSITIRVNGDDNLYNSSVVTTIATNITQNSAQINGLITSTQSNNINTYFEYGTNVYLGMRTPSRTTNGNMSFSEYLTNLSPNTIYYFRAVSEGSNGISRGAIEVFRTTGYVSNNNNYENNNNTNTNTTTRIIREVVQGTTVYGSISPIMLRIENRYQMIGVGDIIDYTVFYKNISISRLTNPMVQVFIPEGITLVNSSLGTYSEDDRVLSVPINDLEPNDEGIIYLQARVDSIDSTLAQIVTTTVLIYTNPNGAQENAMAYVLNNPGNANSLGAAAFFGGRILGMTLIGWLLLIVLILILILITRTYYYRRNTTVTTHSTTTHQ